MFLVDHNTARTDYAELEKFIHGVINRFDGKIEQSLKWAERKLAYPIRYNGKIFTKGAYILVHFNSEPGEVAKMDRIFRLSDTVIRHFIVRDEDGLIDESAMAPVPEVGPVEPVEAEGMNSDYESRGPRRPRASRDDSGEGRN
jgi:small subunit ribosomal protein S6